MLTPSGEALLPYARRILVLTGEAVAELAKVKLPVLVVQGEAGVGRMAEPLEIVAAVEARLIARHDTAGPLSGRRVLVTAGPTHEAIDPVRYIANRSSGKQGFAIARAAAAAIRDSTSSNSCLSKGDSRLPQGKPQKNGDGG